jgi:putative FmdB family regulatory protein
MPTYEYACQSCGRHVEVFQRFSEDSLTTCEVCGGPLRKVFHPAGILFKGSGFYATDSRRSGARSGEKKDEKKGGEAGEKKDAGAKASQSSSGSSGSEGSSSGSSSTGDGSSGAPSKGESSKGDTSKSTEKSA